MGRRALAIGSSALAALALGLAYLMLRPGPALVPQTSTHGPDRAACLDCHVPFSGTPSTRCLGPSCHGALATGTPPRDGPVLPVRYHVVLRGEDCGQCHEEHADRDTATGDPHRGMALEVLRSKCDQCHLDAGPPSHPRTEGSCGRCHTLETWENARNEGGAQLPK